MLRRNYTKLELKQIRDEEERERKKLAKERAEFTERHKDSSPATLAGLIFDLRRELEVIEAAVSAQSIHTMRF